MGDFKVKLLSGMEKCFLDEKIEDKKEITSLSMLSNERLSFQIAYTTELMINKRCYNLCDMSIDSPLSPYITVYMVEHVPVRMPAFRNHKDENYLRTTPGLYPDLLLPYDLTQGVKFVCGELLSLFIRIENKEGIPAGVYPINIKVKYKDEIVCQAEMTVEVIGKMLDDLSIYHTEWFHTDCLANYYCVDVWSEKHWEIIKSFMQSAVDCRVNTILTPVFTLPLDTKVGGERLTTQLVDVCLSNGEYSFGFDKLDRWIDIALGVGIEFFEISHLFTQWGAGHAPKVIATVNGEQKRIFGWETDATSDEYKLFLDCFLEAFISHMKARGLDRKCMYHISDEPSINCFESYSKARAVVIDKLKDYKIIDALSNYDFYKHGLVETPVSSNSHIDDFLDNGVEDLWVYYCCADHKEVSERFISMPGARTRIIGAQIYKYNVKGFLHWGFNFYSSRYSVRPLNPYVDTCGEYFTQGGDCFLVYPAQDGTTYPTLHGEQFIMALEDHKALKLCEETVGREATLKALEEGADKLTFKEYPRSEDYLLRMRDRVNELIKNN